MGRCGDSGGGGVEVVVAGGGDVEMEIVVVGKGCGERVNMRPHELGGNLRCYILGRMNQFLMGVI